MNSAAIISGSVVYKTICQNVRSYGVNPLLPTSCTKLRILVDLQLLGKIWWLQLHATTLPLTSSLTPGRAVNIVAVMKLIRSKIDSALE